MRWLCDLVGYGPDGVRAAHVGRGDGQLHGHGPGPRHPARAAARGRAAAARSDARGRPRVHLGPDPLLDRPGARRAGVPARDARRHPVGRAVPAAWRPGRGGRRTRPGGGLSRSRSRRWPAPRTPVGRCDRRAGRRGRSRGPVAPRGRGLRRRGQAVGARRRSGPRPRPRRFGHGRPAQVVLPGLRHRWPAGPRRRRTRAGVRRPGARVLPRRRDAGRWATAASDGHDDHDDHRTSSTSTSWASRAPAAGGRSSCGCPGSTSAPRASAASSRPTTTSPRTWPVAAPRPTTSRRSPRFPSSRVVCFRHLPGGREAAMALARERAGRPPGPAPGGPRDLRRRLAHDDPARAARPGSEPGSSTTSRPRRTSTVCSRRCGPSLRKPDSLRAMEPHHALEVGGR